MRVKIITQNKYRKTDIMENNWIYIPKKGGKVRYVLGEKGKNPIICIGVNPSTAIPGKLDRTLTKVKNIAKYNKYDGWIMVNVYPLRETKPDNLSVVQDEKIAKCNIKKIKNLLKKYPNSDIWCAWGNVIKKRKFLEEYSKEILKNIPSNRKLLCTELTKKEYPKHPLYCKNESQLIDFDSKKYVYIHKLS